MYERIMALLDGSDERPIVLPHIVEIAAKLGSEIVLVTLSESGDTAHVCRQYLKDIRNHVQYWLGRYGAEDTSRVYTDVLVGRPIDAMQRYADADHIDLIATASRDSSGRRLRSFADMAARMLRGAGRPVLLVRNPASQDSLKDRRLVKRILVPLDGSGMGQAAIAWAQILAKAVHAELVLLRVVKPAPPAAAFSDVGVSCSAPIPNEEPRKAAAAAYLDAVGRAMQEEGIDVSTAVSFGSPAEEIARYGESHGVDLIAMSTHGRTGIRRWMLGSVADSVLHTGDVPILVVPAAIAG